MDNESVSIGKFEITKCTLTKWDGSDPVAFGDLVIEFHFLESIEEQAVRGHLAVLDAVGLLDDYPIIGEEFVEISYTDSYQRELTQKFHVYSVTEGDIDNQGQKQLYHLNIHSLDFIKTESVEIRKSYRGPISSSVQDIFDEYFDLGGKGLEIEETTNEATIVVPSLTPWSAINLLAKKSFSDKSESSHYIFFESRVGYHYKTYEYLFQEGRVLATIGTEDGANSTRSFKYYEPRLESRDRLIANMQTIRDIRIQTRFNLIDDLRSGSMLSEVTTLDPATQTANTVIYQYDEQFDEFVHTDERSKKPHTSDFLKDYFDSEDNIRARFVLFDDTTRVPKGEGTKYNEIMPRRVSSFGMMNRITITATIYGRNDLFVGDMIHIDLPQFKTATESSEVNRNLSGFWLIKNMSHVMKETVWNSHLILVKDSYRGEGDNPKSKYTLKNKINDGIDKLDKLESKVKSIRGIL